MTERHGGIGTRLRAWATAWRGAPATALWLSPAGLWAAGGGAAPPQRFDDLAAWAAAHPGGAARLWLSGWHTLDLLADPALPLPDDAAVLAHLRPLLQHYHGDAAADWPLAAWRAGGRCGASALHGLDWATLQQAAAAHGVTLRAVQPWWPRALALALQREPALGRAAQARLLLVEGGLLQVLDLAHGALCGLQQRRLADATPAALADWLAAADGPTPAAVLGCGLDGHAAPAAAALGHADLTGALPPPIWWQGPAPDARARPVGRLPLRWRRGAAW